MVLAAARADSFWIVTRGRYDIELWTPSATRPVATLERDADFYEEYVPGYETFGPDGRARPSVVSLRRDSTDRLWVALRVHDPRHPPRPRGFLASPPRLQEWPAVFDGLIELIDPRAGRVVTRVELPEPMVFLDAPVNGRIRAYTRGEDEKGYQFFTVWRVELRR